MTSGTAAKKSYVFVADPDREFLESLGEGPDGGGDAAPRPLTAGTVVECDRKLSVRLTQIVAAFVSPTLGHPAWLAVVRSVHTYHPGIPIFLICRTAPAIAEEELRNLGVAKVLLKPVSYPQMLAAMSGADLPAAAPPAGAAGAPPSPLAHDDENLDEFLGSILDEPAAESVEPEGDELDLSVPEDEATAPPAGAASDRPKAEELAFISLSAAKLVTRAPASFDIYVRLGPDHYTRIWKAGDEVSAETFQRQTKSGVTEYFIKTGDQERFLRTYDELVQKLIESPSLPLAIKLSEVQSIGANTLNLLKRQGLGRENVRHAVEYVASSQKSVAKLARAHPELRRIFMDTEVQDHAIATVLLGSVFLRALGMQEGEAASQLGVALMLHDVALWGAPQVVQDEELLRMDKAQAELYHAHPEESARILKGVRDLPRLLVEAVADHHVRLGRKGFPAKPDTYKPNRLAELIGICDEVARRIKATAADKRPAMLTQLRNELPQWYSPEIVNAFDRAFLA